MKAIQLESIFYEKNNKMFFNKLLKNNNLIGNRFIAPDGESDTICQTWKEISKLNNSLLSQEIMNFYQKKPR